MLEIEKEVEKELMELEKEKKINEEKRRNDDEFMKLIKTYGESEDKETIIVNIRRFLDQLLVQSQPNNRDEQILNKFLRIVVKIGIEMVVKLLLDYGANSNSISEHRHSVLQIVIEKGDENIVKLLLDHGANSNTIRQYHDAYSLSEVVDNDGSSFIIYDFGGGDTFVIS